MPLCILHLKKKLSELDFWISSYDHFNDSNCKTPSSGQNVISFFFDNFFVHLHLFSEIDFNFKVDILQQYH